MITVMIVTDNIKENELIAASIIGGFEHSICVITSTDKVESERLIRTQKHDVDIFILKVRMKRVSGKKLAQLIRSCDKYRDTPILFITSINHNMVGFSELATYQGYKKENYISTPIRRIDVQGNYAVISTSGMGYYSLTGATMTDYYGIEAGTYGFVVNVVRDVFTILLMPLLVRISKGSPIAAGAAGCMDTMLVPVTKAVGTELGIVALLSGTILTFIVPVWLPMSRMLFGINTVTKSDSPLDCRFVD